MTQPQTDDSLSHPAPMLPEIPFDTLSIVLKYLPASEHLFFQLTCKHFKDAFEASMFAIPIIFIREYHRVKNTSDETILTKTLQEMLDFVSDTKNKSNTSRIQSKVTNSNWKKKLNGFDLRKEIDLKKVEKYGKELKILKHSATKEQLSHIYYLLAELHGVQLEWKLTMMKGFFESHSFLEINVNSASLESHDSDDHAIEKIKTNAELEFVNLVKLAQYCVCCHYSSEEFVTLDKLVEICQCLQINRYEVLLILYMTTLVVFGFDSISLKWVLKSE